MGDFMVKISCAKETVGFEGKDNSIYGRLITPPKDMNLEIDRDRYFAEMVTNKKIDIAFPTIDIKKLPAERSKEIIQRYSLDEKPFVIVFPGAGEPYKIWQAQRFAAIIDYLVEKNIIPVICGNSSEKKLVKEILSYAKYADKVIDLSGQTDLPTLAHILIQSKFYFGSDTGILHLAMALRIPTVALTWEGSLGRFFPYSNLQKNIAICARSSSDDALMVSDKPLLELDELHPSIKDISVEQVITELEKMESMIDTNINNHG
jgi:ADP-heptose:LPS heptosyltransferase